MRYDKLYTYVPLGCTVTAGIECMFGSEIYFISTGMSLLITVTKVSSKKWLNSSTGSFTNTQIHIHT